MGFNSVVQDVDDNRTLLGLCQHMHDRGRRSQQGSRGYAGHRGQAGEPPKERTSIHLFVRNVTDAVMPRADSQ